MTTRPRQGLVALATALACLILMASPASATTHLAAVTGGTLTLSGNVGSVANIALAGTVGTGCGSTMTYDVYGTAVRITSFVSVGRIGAYVAVVQRLNDTPGTYSGSTISAVGLSLRVDFYTPAMAGTSCATSALQCRLTMNPLLAGTVTAWTISNTVTLSTPTPATVAAGGSCTLFLTDFIGGTASVTNLTSVLVP